MYESTKRFKISRFIKLISIFITFIIISSTTIPAQLTEQQKIQELVSYPGLIPNFHNYQTPSIVPGDTGELKFFITNRYNSEYNNTMRNISLVVNIYEYSTLEENKKIDKISNAPEITGGSEGLKFLIDKWTARFFWPELEPERNLSVSINIKTSPGTPEGRYFIRTLMNFTFNDYSFEMKSRAYFTDSKWEEATRNITDQLGWVDDHLIAGRLDLTILKVDGIIPETSFRVLTPFPTTYLYICIIPIIVGFLFLGFFFYLMDEKGKFPKLKRKLDDFGTKVEDIRYRRR